MKLRLTGTLSREEITEAIKEYLAKRGLTLNEESTEYKHGGISFFWNTEPTTGKKKVNELEFEADVKEIEEFKRERAINESLKLEE